MADNPKKRRIKIYQKTYELPALSGGNLDELQKKIRRRNDCLNQGRLVLKPVEQWGLLGKITVEQWSRQPLTFEERYQELNAIIDDYDSMVSMLKYHESDYQRFFQDLSQEIREIITRNCQVIGEKERKRVLKEQEERRKPNPNAQSLALLANMKRQLLEITKSTGYAAVLMIKKLELMSKSLERIATDQEKQKEFLASVLAEIQSQKDLYELQIEINALQKDTAKLVDTALNFDEYMKPFMGNFQTLLNNVAQVDQELSRAIGEIDNIARLLESQQFSSLERDQDSQRIADFLILGELKKDHLQEGLDQIGNVTSGAMFDAELLTTGRDLSLEDCLANIQEFMGVKFNQLKAVPVVETLPLEIPKPVVSIQKKLESIFLPGGLSLELVKIPAGNFLMGSNEDDHEKPPHRVALPEFYLGKTPITQAQWQAVMGNNPSRFSGNPKNPVEQVSWNDCQTFCKKLSDLTGKICRLPSEAEWEYACRAGTESRYSFGNDQQLLQNYAWYALNSNGRTQPVGLKQPNNWGLYDMHGNVWEWCADDWHNSYAEKPQNLKNDGSTIWSSSNLCGKSIRGGSWGPSPRACCSACRDHHLPTFQYYFLGFRVVCVRSRLS